MNQTHAFCWISIRFWYFSCGFLKESNTTTRARSISILTKIQWKLLTLKLWKKVKGLNWSMYSKLKWWKKVKGLTRSCTATEWLYRRAAHPRPWICYSLCDLAIYVHSPHVWHLGPWSRCCRSPSFGILALSSYTIKNKRRGWESRDLVELEYRNERKHLHSKYTDEGLV